MFSVISLSAVKQEINVGKIATFS